MRQVTGRPLIGARPSPVFPVVVGAMLVVLSLVEGVGAGHVEFRCGDADLNGAIGAMSDGLHILSYLVGDGDLACEDAADFNDNGRVNIADVFHQLHWGFSSCSAPPSPFLDYGLDPTDDAPGCLGFDPCE